MFGLLFIVASDVFESYRLVLVFFNAVLGVLF